MEDSDGVTPGKLKTEPVCLAPKKGENRKGGFSLISKTLFHVKDSFSIIS